MDKGRLAIIIIITLVLIGAVFSPNILRAAQGTIIRVRDAQTQNFLANAQVGLAQNYMPLFQGYTDLNGIVYVDGNIFQTVNAIYADYFVSRPDYREVNGAKTFYAGETTIFDIQPNVFCGDYVCTSPPENVQNCPRDCAKCGDGICSKPPEYASNCPADCVATHRVCFGGIKCVTVSGAGANQCTTSSECSRFERPVAVD